MLMVIDAVSSADSVSSISSIVIDGLSCDGLTSQVGPWVQSSCLEMKALASTPLVMRSAEVDVVGQNLRVVDEMISLIRCTRCLMHCCRKGFFLDTKTVQF